MGFWGKGNIGKISKGTVEHEPTFREQETKLYKLEDEKHFDIRNKERYLIILRFYLRLFMHHCHWFCLLYTRDHNSFWICLFVFYVH